MNLDVLSGTIYQRLFWFLIVETDDRYLILAFQTDLLMTVGDETQTNGEGTWPANRDYLEVYVSAIEHPGHFWVQLVNAQSAQLDRLTREMTAYYGNPSFAKVCSSRVRNIATPLFKVHADPRMFLNVLEFEYFI